MKLLIVTQVVDQDHPILGFFHRWIEEFAKHCEHVHVICLQQGIYSLPANVTVHSLGKEAGKGRLHYLVRFYRLIWQLRHEYDKVFVHMNQIYVILGTPLWKVLQKRVTLWYMHSQRSLTLRLAICLVDDVCTGSKDSFPLKSRKVRVTGHGIDTEYFAPQQIQKTIDLLTVGRITPSKNLEFLIDTVAALPSSHPASLTIVGIPQTVDETRYFERLLERVNSKGLANKVLFKGKVNQKELPRVLGSARIFVTAAQNGSLDKAMLEAMAVGVPIVSMAPGAASLPLGSAQTTSKAVFTNELKKMIESDVTFVPEHVAYVRGSHSLATLVPKLIA